MKNFLLSFPLYCLFGLFILLSLTGCEEDVFIEQTSKSDSLVTKILTEKEILEKTNILNRVRNIKSIYGRDDSTSYEVSLNDVLYVADQNSETFTFPVLLNNQSSRFNIVIHNLEGELTTSLIEYDLSQEQLDNYNSDIELDAKTVIVIL